MYDEENLGVSRFQSNVDITNRAKTEQEEKKKKSTPKSRVFQDVSSPVQGIGYLKFWVPRVETNAQGFVDTREPDKSTGSEALLTNKDQYLNICFFNKTCPQGRNMLTSWHNTQVLF